jgi:hypothetical protein
MAGGKNDALDRLMPLVYEELHHLIASRHMSREWRVSRSRRRRSSAEAYPRLVDQREVDWQNRAHCQNINFAAN